MIYSKWNIVYLMDSHFGVWTLTKKYMDKLIRTN